MFTYEGGLLIAFLFWLWGIIRIILFANSRTQKNLKLIGKRMSYNLGAIVDYDFKQESFLWKTTKFIVINILLPLPFVLLSWIYVFFVIFNYMYVFSKDLGAPQAIKEFRWKLRNVDMSFDQMIRELIKLDEQNPDDFERVKSEMIEFLKNKQSNTLN